MSDWTRDEHGNYVDWTKEPYRVGSQLYLVLDGEVPDRIPAEIRIKRIGEYYKLMRREMKKGPQAGET